MAEGQQALEYILKSADIMAAINAEAKSTSELLMADAMGGNLPEGQRHAEKILGVVRQHKQQLDALAVPQNCRRLHAAILKWFGSNEEMYAALSKGDVRQARLLAQQMVQAYGEMGKEAIQLTKQYEAEAEVTSDVAH